MVYIPQPGDEGLALFLVALRDYLAADPSIVSLLPEGASSIIPEGFLTESTPTPVILMATVGDGAQGPDVQLVRLILYVMDRDRGYYNIERILARMRKRLNDTQTARDFFTFPPEEPLKLWGIEASGSTTSATFPNWKMEGRGLYVFAQLGGLS